MNQQLLLKYTEKMLQIMELDARISSVHLERIKFKKSLTNDQLNTINIALTKAEALRKVLEEESTEIDDLLTLRYFLN